MVVFPVTKLVGHATVILSSTVLIMMKLYFMLLSLAPFILFSKVLSPPTCPAST
jgi:hypothetical protein